MFKTIRYIFLNSFFLYAQDGIDINGMNFSSNNSIHGSGKIITQTMKLQKFTKVNLSTSVNYTVEKSSTYGYTIQADDNLIKNFIFKIKSGKLFIFTKKSYTSNSSIHITLRVKKIEELNIEGSVDVLLKNFNESTLRLNVDGAIDVHSSEGSIETLTLNSNGSYDVNLEKINVNRAKVLSKGSGDIYLNVRDKLNVKLLDNTTLYYQGNPRIKKEILDNAELEKQ